MDRMREEAEANAAFDPKLLEPYIIKDPQARTINAAKALENLGKAASVWLKPRETGEIVDPVAEPVAEMVKTMGKVAEYWMSDPKRTLEAQGVAVQAVRVDEYTGRRFVFLADPDGLPLELYEAAPAD